MIVKQQLWNKLTMSACVLAARCADNSNKTFNSDTASNSNMTSNNSTNGGAAAATPTQLGLNSPDMQQLDTNTTGSNATEFQLQGADIQDFDSKLHFKHIVFSCNLPTVCH